MAIEELGKLTGEYRRRSGADAVGLLLGGIPVVASDRETGRFEMWQYVCGEGPALDAYAGNRPIEVCDVTSDVAYRWPLLGKALDAWPFSRLIALPFGFIGAVGTLCFYSKLSNSRGTDRAATAECAAHMRAWLMTNLDADRHVDLGMYDLINCATGVVMAQMELGCDDAVAVIRAHAFSSPVDLATVLQDIVELRLQLPLN